MKIVNILGGLGNQLFQYAFAVALKAEFPVEEVKISTQSFRGYPLHNGFELDRLFDIQLPFATVGDLWKTAYPWSHYRLWQIGRRFLPRRKSMVWDEDLYHSFKFDLIKDKSYFDGYWQAPLFFEKHRQEIVNAFKMPEFNEPENLKLLDFIKKDNTAFVHVRRGDYLKNKIYGGITTENYYHRAIPMLRERGYGQIIVFSNDIPWCKANFKEDFTGCEVIYCDWNKGGSSFRDMQLMGQCDAGIIANSSFSWWGAWLGNPEWVICPDRWTNIPGHRDNIFPAEWQRVRVK